MNLPDLHVSRIDRLGNFPKLISIETINTCNARCTFCPHPILKKNNNIRMINGELFTKIIQECSKYEDLEVITLSFQNEPLMDPYLFHRIRYVREVLNQKVKICFVTNGYLFNDDKLREFENNPPDILKYSIYGIDKITYENTMVGLKFERTLNQLKSVINISKHIGKPYIQINIVYTDEISNIKYKNILDYWEKYNVNVQFVNVENRAGIFKEYQKSFSINNWRNRIWCQRPFRQLSVWPDGNVALCCADWIGEVKLGNVNKISLYNIWNGNIINYYRIKLLTGDIKDLNPCNKCMQADIVIDGEEILEYNNYKTIE